MVKPPSLETHEKNNSITTKLFMQNIDPSEKTQNNEFVQQFTRLNITFTEDDIQR